VGGAEAKRRCAGPAAILVGACAVLCVLLALSSCGCGQPDLSKVKLDNPVVEEAWRKYAEAEEAGVSDILLQRVKEDLQKQENHLKKYYLDTGNPRNEGLEVVVAGLTAELQKYIDDKEEAEKAQGLIPSAEQELIFEQIEKALAPELAPGQYVYAIALSRQDPTWAVAWLDEDPLDFQASGPAFALRPSQEKWVIKQVGYDPGSFLGLPPGLADGSDAYQWLSDTAWVVTQVRDYTEATRPGQAYRVFRFRFDSGMNYAYVFLKFEEEALGFRYQKTLRTGWALLEVDQYPPEAGE